MADSRRTARLVVGVVIKMREAREKEEKDKAESQRDVGKRREAEG